MSQQKIMNADNNYLEIDRFFEENQIICALLICGASLSSLRIKQYFDRVENRLPVKIVKFTDFCPNPDYQSVVNGIRLFCKEKCNAIIAVGGGSAIDVAKCIKLFCNMDPNGCFLEQTIIPNDIPLLAIPTTAGAGSESTKYAVIYRNGEKQSIEHTSCIPSYVLMDPGTLQSLPLYQKKATMLDALCHSIESFWSVNSTIESKAFSKKALGMILRNKEDYLANNKDGNANMLTAAYLAGKAINITQTTAGHAMCYKLTSLYGMAHGHAAALCVSKLWPYMTANISRCSDIRGTTYLREMFEELSEIMGCTSSQEAVKEFNSILSGFDLPVPSVRSVEDFTLLRSSVNPVRLKNNPIKLDEQIIDMLYHQILERNVNVES